MDSHASELQTNKVLITIGAYSFRCAENFIFDVKEGLNGRTIGKAFREYRRLEKELKGNSGVKVRDENHFLVHIQGMMGKLPKSEDIIASASEHYDLLSAFQSYFVFQGEIYSMTTYSCPLTRYSKYLLNEIDCFLLLGNENLHLSRKDCADALALIQEENLSNVVMANNTSLCANQDAWPNQMEKEQSHAHEYPEAVIVLRQYLEQKQLPILNIDQFSHHNVSLIFNHLLKQCIARRKTKKRIEFKAYTDDSTNKTTTTPEKGGKKCLIF